MAKRPRGRPKGSGVRPPEERFWSHVLPLPEDLNECWLWKGAVDKKGYGAWWWVHERPRSAHRYAYEWAYGSIPEGLTVDHLCRIKLCVNPKHLEAVTLAENSRRGARAYWQAVIAKEMSVRRARPRLTPLSPSATVSALKGDHDAE